MITSDLDAWVTCPRPNPQARLRVFCFPYAGAGASIFRNWHAGLPREVEVCPIQLPGREGRLRETPFPALPPLIPKLAQVLSSFLNLPFVFFGHCMGALISFELARHLRRQRCPGPVHLFASGQRAPQLPSVLQAVHQLPDAQLIGELRRLNAVPEEVLQDTEFMRMLLPTLRADFAICATYAYNRQDPLDCSISALGGVEDFKVSHDQLAAWREQTHGTFTEWMFPGDHFFLHTAQADILRAISQDLTRLLAWPAECRC